MDCEHMKVYADYFLTSNSSQQKWICSDCGETGIDTMQYHNGGTISYECLEKYFADLKNNRMSVITQDDKLSMLIDITDVLKVFSDKE